MATRYSATIKIEEKPINEGFWLLTSKDLPGFMLSGKDLIALRQDVPAVLKQFFKLNFEMDIEVRRHVSPVELKRKVPAEYLSSSPASYAAIPRAKAA